MFEYLLLLYKNNQLKSVTVYDIAGKMASCAETGSNEKSVAVGGLVNGAYIMKVINRDNRISVHKIMR